MADDRAFQPLKDEQARASSPGAHVWLSASAGTGKTHVLSARVLRLLLAGVEPERILCLTFTKAGAAEMAERVHERLARWVQGPTPDVRKDLFALGEATDDAAVEKARLLFARVLEATGGGLKIQTIHSFCQTLLAAFPLEAGLVPGFTPLDERGQAELSRGALIAMLEAAEAAHDAPVLEAVSALAIRLGEDGTRRYLARCVSAAQLLDALPEALEEALLEQLELPGGDLAAHLAGACGDDCFPVAALRRLQAANMAWGGKTGSDTAAAIAGWLESASPVRGAGIAELVKLLLTKDGEVKNRTREKLLAAEPDYVPLCTEVGERLLGLAALEAQVAYARLAAQGLVAGRAYARAYQAAMRAKGAVDFDDLIGRASALLAQEGMGEWIRFKLDQRVDHILVDEAQDTNQAQWDIVEAIVGDYFEVEADDLKGALRTLFVVGDTKQAIFGFQGTSPQAFLDAFARFQRAARRSEQPFEDLPLALSFRTVPAVLEVVDATLDALGAEAVGLATSSPAHRSARPFPGEVLLLPPTTLIGGGEEEEEGGEEEIEGEEGWLSDHHRLHAQKIAAQVKAWLDPAAPLQLRAKGRAARAGDVLILVRSRGALARLIVARLYEAGVPVAGVDRLRLQAPLGVQDLLAGLRFAVQPEDDLNLACLLVSPLLGWSQDALMHRALREKGVGLWSHLRATQPEAALAPLRALLAAADFSTPYRYLEAMLSGPMDGRRKLLARLGEEARDAIDELLNAALAFERDDHPSLQRFIAWFDRDEADIKRELAEAGDAVRVMTVHGAKGLEAPIVILADATHDPGRKPRAHALDLPVGTRSLPLLPARKGERGDLLARAAEEAERLEREEHWRLLYVAMTRAQEMLVVSGALGPRLKGETPDASWHRAVEGAMRGLGVVETAREGWGDALAWTGAHPYRDAPAEKAERPAASERPALPAWLRAPAPVEARPPRPLAPSAGIEDDVPDPPPSPTMRAAAERGRLLHALFERLPDVPRPERRAAALAWLAGPGRVTDEAARAELVEHVLAVIEAPGHAALFASDALAEAPIAAVVGEQVVAGTVDRLLVTGELVHVVDFKTGRSVPASADEVPLAHLKQMAAYAAALGVIFPGRTVRASLLYTAEARLVDLPDAALARHKPGLAGAEDSFAGAKY